MPTSGSLALVRVISQSASESSRPRPAPPGPTADLLAQVPLFTGMSRRALNHLAREAKVVTFAPSDYIIIQDKPGKAFFAIISGRATLKSKGKKIKEFGPGEYFGELALLDGGPRTGSVIASEKTMALRLERASLLKLIRSDPRVATAMLAELAGRLRQATESFSH